MTTTVLGRLGVRELSIAPVADTITEPKVEISELFLSVQGEGPSLGVPAVFVRTHRCPLRCNWANGRSPCDTMYAVDPTHPEYNDYRKMTVDEIVQEVQQIRQKAPLIVFTGGEPMLWERPLASVARALQFSNMDTWFEVETVGVIEPKVLHTIPTLTFNVSPKLRSSGNEGRARINPKALRFFSDLEKEKQAVFKFVVTRENLKQDIQEICELRNKYNLRDIYLMPAGSTPEEVVDGCRELVGVCCEYGWRLTTRLHIELWKNERGR